MKTLAERGYEVVPVNANADTIDGKTCYRSLTQIPTPVEAVVTVVPPLQTLMVVDDCVRLGIEYLWMQQGSESREAILRAEASGINVVHHACIIMYADPTGIHRIHRWIHDVFAHSDAKAASNTTL
jgi:predicted CoA-binding protein